ncbi:MAG TPA: branched-chain amino acid ABC transporter substrate-binding protein [Candidatus Dormibacteraeota bacterium]
MLAGCTIGGATPARSMGVIKLGADLPLSGDDAPDGTPVKNSIDLAVKQAGRVCGASQHQDACFDLQALTYDDVTQGIHDPATGAKNVQLLAGDHAVLAMVGPLYDSLARSELPVANSAQLAMVSPATTDECLTQEPPDGHCQGLDARLRPGGANNFFRVVATQLDEGAAAADLAFKTLGKRRAFVINDQTSFGQGLATGFVARFVRDGGAIVDPSDLGAFDPNQPAAFGSRVQRALELAADVIYFAGAGTSAAAALRREMAARMPQVPLIGSDRLANSQFAKSAGASARGTYYTVVGPYPANLRQAQGFIRDYRKQYGQDVGTYSVPAFDAVNLLIAAIGRAIDDAAGSLPTREQVRRQVALTTDYRGVMGAISFDAHGDTSLKLITAYQWLAPTDPAGRFAALLTVDG